MLVFGALAAASLLAINAANEAPNPEAARAFGDILVDSETSIQYESQYYGGGGRIGGYGGSRGGSAVGGSMSASTSTTNSMSTSNGSGARMGGSGGMGRMGGGYGGRYLEGQLPSGVCTHGDCNSFYGDVVAVEPMGDMAAYMELSNGQEADMRILRKNKDEQFMVPQPMEFVNFPHAEPSVSGYASYPISGSVQVAPYTSIIETDDRYRLTSVMSANNDADSNLVYAENGQPMQPRRLGKDSVNSFYSESERARALRKQKDQQFMVPQPMEFVNFPHAEPSVGGYKPYPVTGTVQIAPNTSIIETDDRFRLTSVMSADTDGKSPTVVYPDAHPRRLEKDNMFAVESETARALRKQRDQQFMVPQPMEFANFPHAEASVGGYKRPGYGTPMYGRVDVAPWTSIIETDDRMRLTSVMSSGDAVVVSPSGSTDAFSAASRRMSQQGSAAQQNAPVSAVHDVPYYKWRRVSELKTA